MMKLRGLFGVIKITLLFGVYEMLLINKHTIRQSENKHCIPQE